jgi:Ca-activated chloride channel family protein
LVELVEENAKSKIFLTVLGYGMGNTNDAMMEQISNRGNGVYAFVDSRREAHRQMVQQLAGNLMTVAKDVKIQVEFNPQQVQAYRLIGYENRIMAAEDFNNDKKDAGEIGAGHRVTALYEIVPPEAGDDAGRGRVEELRYQPRPEVVAPASPPVAAAHQNELLAVKLRYKQPEGDTSQLLTFPLAVPDADHDLAFAAADRDLQWAAVVAEFGMLLRGSQYRGNATWSSLVERAIEAAGVSPDASRQECLEMMRRAAALSGR